MTEFVDVRGGRIAYEVTGSGPLVVLSQGIGVRRQDHRFLAPMLAQAGYRVAAADLRGHGESSMVWPSITRTAGHLAASELHRGNDADGLVRQAECQPRRYRATGPGPAAQVRTGPPCTTAPPPIPHAASIALVA